MSKGILIRGAKVARASGLREEDVYLRNGCIEKLGTDLPAEEGDETVEAAGKVILPGLFDMNVHLREPGREDKEGIFTGSLAAMNGGFTGLLAMPNTDPPIDSAGMVQSVRDLAMAKSGIPIHTAGCLTKRREGEELAAIGEMGELGVVMLTDDPLPVENPQVLRRAMEYAREFDMIVGVHSSTPSLWRGGAMNEGEVSYTLGLTGIPAIAEEIAIERDLALARLTGCRLHIQHVSTARGVAAIRRAKDEGIAVTCEAAVHHLLFDESAVGDYDTYYKVDPPLRLPEDCTALLAGVLDGTIDVLTCDHAPHSEFEKNADFASAPFGISGLDTALLALHHHLIAEGKLSWMELVAKYADAPRQILGLKPARIVEGEPSNFIIFNPDAETVVERDFLRSQGCNNPFLGKTLKGSVDALYFSG